MQTLSLYELAPDGDNSHAGDALGDDAVRERGDKDAQVLDFYTNAVQDFSDPAIKP